MRGVDGRPQWVDICPYSSYKWQLRPPEVDICIPAGDSCSCPSGKDICMSAANL